VRAHGGGRGPYRLVILEGLMGTGKSTMCRWLVGQLRGNGVPVRVFGNPRRGQERGPDAFRTALAEVADPGALWASVSATALAARSRHAWDSFVAQTDAWDGVALFDGRFLYADIAGLLLMDAPPDEIAAHAKWIADRVRPLGARLIYLEAESAADGLQRVAWSRGRAWLEAMSAGEGGNSRAARARLDSPFFRGRDLHGHAGTVAFLHSYLELCATIIPKLDLPHLRLETWKGDWSAYHVEILRFLGLTAVPDHNYAVWWWTKRPRLWLGRVLGAVRHGSSARMNL
jgi:hypothetical protein